ncbi:hypothetical protein [Lentilitoribacter sp. EG35]|uniref:hypothetical protein n=1 Tax=Lentilitoribacter sp. EG35 TaxID=3234192 RepID=UPI003460A104
MKLLAKYSAIFVLLIIAGQGFSFAKSNETSVRLKENDVVTKTVSKGIFLSIEDQQLADLAFSVGEMSNYFAKSFLEKQGALFFLAGEGYIKNRKIDVRILDFITEQQRNAFVDETANHENCYIRKRYLGSQPVVFGIANIESGSFDENRKCMILTFAYFAGQSVAELQNLQTQQIFPIYFEDLLEKK